MTLPEFGAEHDPILTADTLHLYVSTACLHDIHWRCRRTCKFCRARCLCPCHSEEDQA